MNTFKKTTLYTALAGIGALGMAGTANAVHVNPDGLGQALIYPYYTVQAAAPGTFASLLSVVNSTSSAKAVKVRFLEGKNSKEVLDFNLYLSPRDVWVAGIVGAGAAAGGGAGIYTNDKSCTTPTVSSDPNNPSLFVNFAYVGDSGGDGLDRTREGYVEIIEMGNVTGTTAVGVTHVAGVPPCTGLSDSVAQANTVLGNGGLFGGITLINVLNGEDISANAVALEAFRTAGAPIWFAPGVTLPDLTLANPPQTEIFNGTTATTYTFLAGIDAVSAALMHNTLMNEYVLDTATKSGTDWVVTFPTKRFYVNGTTASPPFQRPFAGGISCDDISVTTWDREERAVTVSTGFSPPQAQSPLSLCFEANVVTFKGSNVLGSANLKDLTAATLPVNAQNGWALFDFTSSLSGAVGAHQLVSVSPTATFHGLPVIGFMAQNFVNGVLSVGPLNVQSNYAGTFVHRTTKLIN
ncbi:MAG: hypothetical protein DMG78_27685 [Acidobacteria bacterium]|nr:MAG: hypothetical protein DMG78_27685 [Acidobacteriota bacterium]